MRTPTLTLFLQGSCETRGMSCGRHLLAAYHEKRSARRGLAKPLQDPDKADRKAVGGGEFHMYSSMSHTTVPVAVGGGEFHVYPYMSHTAVVPVRLLYRVRHKVHDGTKHIHHTRAASTLPPNTLLPISTLTPPLDLIPPGPEPSKLGLDTSKSV